MPDDKLLCPGVIECQSNYIEHPELVAQRIERYARLVGRERVLAGVDGGFSVHAGMRGIDPDVVWGSSRVARSSPASASGARDGSDGHAGRWLTWGRVPSRVPAIQGAGSGHWGVKPKPAQGLPRGSAAEAAA